MIGQIYKFYRKVYFDYYSLSMRTNGPNDAHWHVALLGIVIVTFLNVFGITMLFVLLAGVRGGEVSLHIAAKIVVLLLFAIPHYFAFVYKGRYLKIRQEFANRRKKMEAHRPIITWIYTIGSVIFAVFILLILAYVNRGAT